MLKLRTVEIVGFKSFCERTVVTFSGTGTTCIVGPMGVLSSAYLMTGLPLRTWMRLVIWLVIGLMIYFGYSMRKSKLAGAGN